MGKTMGGFFVFTACGSQGCSPFRSRSRLFTRNESDEGAEHDSIRCDRVNENCFHGTGRDKRTPARNRMSGRGQLGRNQTTSPQTLRVQCEETHTLAEKSNVPGGSG